MTTDDPASEEEHHSLMAHSTPILSSFFDSHFSIGAYFATARPEANGIWISMQQPILCDGETRSKAVSLMAYVGCVDCLTVMGYESMSTNDLMGGVVTW
jgi:hypothetical protein